MCGTCGCGMPDEGIRIYLPGDEAHSHQHSHAHTHGDRDHTHPHSHDHMHDHEHPHTHDHDELHEHAHHEHSHEILVEQDILDRNQRLAERNRGFFEGLGIKAFNLVSSPGSGKTTLLEKTIPLLINSIPVQVIEGDQQTSNDAERIQASGAPVVQVNTGNGCHLDAIMVRKAMDILKPVQNSIVFIENVGNLVCPALFDLGESLRIVIISVTEGDDKPLKYPNMFQSAQVCVINKIDLLPYVPFDIEKLKASALRVNSHLQFFELSALCGQGMDEWISWLKAI